VVLGNRTPTGLPRTIVRETQLREIQEKVPHHEQDNENLTPHSVPQLATSCALHTH